MVESTINGNIIRAVTINGEQVEEITANGDIVFRRGLDATGGDDIFEVYDTQDSKFYNVHQFNSNGTFSVSSAFAGAQVDALIVAGGGGGGHDEGGGGGAGGVLFTRDIAVSENNYSIVVGSGGRGGTDGGATNGGDSEAFGLTALGGGAGGGGGQSGLPEDGGSGGGGTGEPNYSNGEAGGSGVSGQGNDGGRGDKGPRNGAGGGGAGEVGGDAGSSNNQPGNGGDGLDYSTQFNTSVGEDGYFGGGGAGAPDNREGYPPSGFGIGGLGGGGEHGRGLSNGDSGEDGMANTGGGGGASAVGGSSGSGGSGVVFVRYETGEAGFLFGESESYNVIHGNPSIDRFAGSIDNIYSDGGSGDGNVVEFNYNNYRGGFTLQYEQVDAPDFGFLGYEPFLDRYHAILDVRRPSDNERIFTVNVVDDNEIHVYNPESAADQFPEIRRRNEGTGISATGIHTIDVDWNGSKWVVDIDNGAYVESIDNVTDPIGKVYFGTDGSSDRYIDGIHRYNIQEIFE